MYFTSLGMDFIEKLRSIKKNVIKVKIWDTAGQERFRTITKSFYQQSQGIILVFDVTNKTSFDKIESWINSLKEKTQLNAVKILVANKIDDNDNRVITTEEGKDLAKLYNMDYYETSAKTRHNVNEMFDKVILNTYYALENIEKTQSFSIGHYRKSKKPSCC